MRGISNFAGVRLGAGASSIVVCCALGLSLAAAIGCGASDNAGGELVVASGGNSGLGGAGNGGQSPALGGVPASGTGGASSVGGMRALGGAGMTGGTGGTGGAGGIGLTGGTSSSAGGSPNTVDLAEKGLCQVAVACSQAIVDTPAVACSFAVKDSAGTTVYDDHASVQLRGRSSLSFPKKNYGLELRTAADVDNPANLLGMGQEADWILDGAWADRSFMRNRLSFGLFRDIDPQRWAPQARYCELTINARYAGIYVLLEKIKRDDDRVVLPDDDGTGSTFIVKQDDDGALRLSIGSGSRWQVVYPNSSVITPTQAQAVQNWLTQLGTALSGSTPAALLDIFEPAAIIDWILLEEFAKNIDAYNLSLYFARSAGGLARVIPWDMDLTYGQPTLRNATNELPQGWIYNRTALIAKLSAVPTIRQGLGPRWRQLRSGIFSASAITARLDGYAAILNADAIAQNFALWPIEQVDFSQIYPPYSFYKVTNYADEVTRFRSWIEQRLTWMDANIDSYPAQ